ncbi:MAG TPA: hypothetical protein VFW48_11115 [Solirubrobacterales bacterium]|nr:hypothetical protein [Solirubrobacterales bacterium]
MRRGLIGVVLLVLLAVPASAGAVQGYKAECQTAFCGGVSEDGSRAVFPFYEELTEGAERAQVYERVGGVTRALVPYPDDPPERTYVNLVGLSDDARHAFVSTNLALVPADLDGGGTDVYDIFGGVPTLLSTGPLDTQAEPGFGPMSVPAFFMGASADGTRVFFDSIFEGFVPEDTDRCFDVYERFGGQTRLISTGPTATPSFPEGTCDMASYDGLSSDGSHVFFKTGDHLIAEDEGGTDIYQRVGDELTVLTTYPERIERNCVDLPWFGDASADGGTVLFSTNMPISAEDTDSTYDVYKRLPDGSYSLVSLGTEGGIGPCGFGGDNPVALSDDGRTAIFATLSSLSPEDRDSSADLYSTDESGSMSLVTTGPADASVDEQVYVSPAWPADFSDDVSHVAFETRQPLVAGDEDEAVDVYLRAGGRTELVSTGPLGGNAGAGADLLSISGDGQTIAFATKERLTDEDADHRMDFYLRRVGQLTRPGSASASKLRKRTVLISAESIAPRMRISSRGKLRGHEVALRLTCPKAEKSGPCRGRVMLARSRHGKPVGSASFRIAPGRHKLARVRLRRRLQKGNAVFARARAADRLGNSATAVRRVTLASR